MRRIVFLAVPYFLGGLLFACLIANSHATPLRMDYTITLLGGTTYQYDFTLTMDNNDGTWVAGQEWDWINFGDNDSGDNYNGFDVDGSGPALPDWTTLSYSTPITSITHSFGMHNGPTLGLAGNHVSPPYWQPTSIGESFVWSGTSGVFIPDGQLYWSALVVDGGAQYVDFELAHGTVVPEPTSLLLFGTGLGVLGLAVYRRRKK